MFGQSDDDLLSDFGGDDFEQIESELDLVTINVAKDVLNGNSIEKKLTNQYFNWDAVLSQKLTYGLSPHQFLFSGERRGSILHRAVSI